MEDREIILQQKTMYLNKIQELKQNIAEYDNVVKELDNKLRSIDDLKQPSLFVD